MESAIDGRRKNPFIFRPNHLNYLDMFKNERYQFQLREPLWTWMGVLTTLLMASIFTAYGYAKLQILVKKKHPNVVFAASDDFFYERDYRVALSDQRFHFAFGLQNIFDMERRIPMDHFKWVALYHRRASDEELNLMTTEVPIRRCTQEDYADFHAVKRRN